MEEKLAIPLYENPTRQKLWRVVWFLSSLFFASAIAFVVFRLVITRDTLSVLAPEGTTTIIRVLKTPKTTAIVENKFSSTLALENTPWTVANCFSWSNREMALFLSDDQVIGIAVDGDLPTYVSARVSEQHLPIFTKDRAHFPRFVLSTLWPQKNGEIITLQDGKKEGTAIRFSEKGIFLKRNGSKTTAPLKIGSQNASPLAVLSLTPEQTRLLQNTDVPLVYSGIKDLFNDIQKNGVTLYFGNDNDGFVYSAVVRDSSLATDELKNLVLELFSAAELQETLSDEGGTTLREYRSLSAESIKITEENGIIIALARDQAGHVLRATKTAHSLVLSNRDVTLEAETPKSSACIANAREFIRPKELFSLLPNAKTPSAQTIFSLFTTFDEVALNNHQIGICW